MGAIDFDFRPANEAEVKKCLHDVYWRLCSGALYKIMVKSDTGEGQVIPYRPNEAQLRLYHNLWYRNIILKARQRGYTTAIVIMLLDHALFNANQRCGIIAQDLEAAQIFFRDKIKLAYDNLPPTLRKAMPLERDSASELLFSHNNSSVRVATSMRSGTIHCLHISEFGKICAKFPDKATEVVTGSFPAVPKDGRIIIESTAEGREGDFYSMTQRAMAMRDSKTKLTERDYRFTFSPWWDDPGYAIDGEAIITDTDNEYFDEVEAKAKTELAPAQRKWYVTTRDSEFSGDAERMWQEYPSYPEEAFRVSTEGSYYAKQLTAARKAQRITIVPHTEGVPVNTFWDIGNGDGTAVWLHQKVGLVHRFIKFIEGWGEPYSYYIKRLQETQYVWGAHWLPHDAEHKRQQGTDVKAPIDMLQALGLGGSWQIVKRVSDLSNGIQMTRDAFAQCWFDETQCKEGIAHLEGYRKQWNERLGCWSEQPVKNIHTEAADAFRQFAQSIDAAGVNADPNALKINYRRQYNVRRT